MNNDLLRPSLRFYLYLIKYNPICDTKSQQFSSSNHLTSNNTLKSQYYGQFLACRIFLQVYVWKDKNDNYFLWLTTVCLALFIYEYFYPINAHIITKRFYVLKINSYASLNFWIFVMLYFIKDNKYEIDKCMYQR